MTDKLEAHERYLHDEYLFYHSVFTEWKRWRAIERKVQEVKASLALDDDMMPIGMWADSTIDFPRSFPG